VDEVMPKFHCGRNKKSLVFDEVLICVAKENHIIDENKLD
jgi:hypothetical protein